MKKAKKQYPENLRTKFGFFFSPFTATMGTMAISYFGMYLTDFAGIDSAMGKTGFAVAFSTIFIILTRIIDAVDDPLQGWLMDSAKETKFGKYRRFGIFGILLVTIGTIMLYGLPGFAKSNAVMLWIWVVIGYLILETGAAMSTVSSPIMQKATTDPQVRSKLTAFIRMGSVIAAIPFIFYVPMIAMLGKATGNLGQAASGATILFCLIFCGISLIGLLMLKERYRPNVSAEKEKAISVKEIIQLIKTDKPLWIHCLALFIGGLAAGTGPLYLIRWKFCADMATGEVDLIKFAALSGTLSIITMIPNFLCPFLLPLAMKLFKAPDRLMRCCYGAMGIGFVVIYACNLLNILTPTLLFILYFLVMVPNGMSAMLMTLLTVECADYAEYNLGRNMTAMVSSLYNFTIKASSVIGTAIPSILLIAVGYSVNEETGAYMGTLEHLPGMVDGLGVLMGPVPAAFGIIAYLIYRFGYKITPEYRQQMRDTLAKRHAEQGEEAQ